jgi:hypothetical protein
MVTISYSAARSARQARESTNDVGYPSNDEGESNRNTENLRGVEAVVSIDRFSSSEGAEGSDILTVTLRLVGSGADDTPPSAPRNSKLCQLWVKSVALCNRRPPVDVRYVPVSDRDCVALQYVAKGHKPTFLRNLVEPTKSASARALATPPEARDIRSVHFGRSRHCAVTAA